MTANATPVGTPTALPRHRIDRIRREPRRRVVTVTAITELGPRMRRIEFSGADLADFESLAPDDHVKLFLPDPGAPDGIAMRDYTPRRFDAVQKLLTIDFVLHDTGIATSWARRARIGDELAIGGPRGSLVVADDFDHYLLVGDGAALPAIGRRLEELRPGVPVVAILLVDGPEDIQHFATAAALTPVWLFRRNGEDDAALVLDALNAWKAPAGDGYVWIAAEAALARMVRDHMLDVRRHPKAWLKAAGYWVRGAAGTTDKLEG